jgi:hypothetical protein
MLGSLDSCWLIRSSAQPLLVPLPLLKFGLFASHAISPAAAMTGSPLAVVPLAIEARHIRPEQARSTINQDGNRCFRVPGEENSARIGTDALPVQPLITSLNDRGLIGAL